MTAFRIVLIILAVILFVALLWIGLGFVFFNIALGSKKRPDPKVPAKGSLFERNSNNETLIAGYKWFDETEHMEVTIDSHEKGKKLHAQYFINDSEKWAICIHGWTNINRELSSYAMEYYKRGFNVLIPDLRGHGNSESKYVSMGWLDRLEVVDWIQYIVKNVSDAKIVLHGVSMGAATTMMTTGENLPKNVVCAIEDCGYTSVYDIFEDQCKRKYKLPPKLIMPVANLANQAMNGFSFKEASSVEQVKKSHTPTLFIHGDKDDFVLFPNLDRVYKACAASKEIYVMHDAEHAVSNIMFHETYWKVCDEYLARFF